MRLVTNQLELNISKTKYIVFRAKRNKLVITDIDIRFNSYKLEKVESLKCLSVCFHENLF